MCGLTTPTNSSWTTSNGTTIAIYRQVEIKPTNAGILSKTKQPIAEGIRRKIFSIQCFPIYETALLLEVPRLRPFVLLITATCRWRWVWSIGGMILTWQGKNKVLGRKLVRLPLLFSTNLIWIGLGSEPGLRNETLIIITIQDWPRTAQQTHSVPVIYANHLMLYREAIAVVLRSIKNTEIHCVGRT